MRRRCAEGSSIGGEMKNKTLFVTGGNEGIGLATALLFAEQGVNVAIMGRRADRNARARDAISAKGVKSIAITGDVSSGAAMSDAVKQVLDTFGGLHFAFNNAGVSDVPTPFVQSTEADYDRLMGINLKGIWLAMKYELPAIAVSGGGSIVNTGFQHQHRRHADAAPLCCQQARCPGPYEIGRAGICQVGRTRKCRLPRGYRRHGHVQQRVGYGAGVREGAAARHTDGPMRQAA